MTKSKNPLRVLLVDDSPLIRDILRDILESEPDIQVIGEAGDGKEAIAKVGELQPDLVTMDIEMPVMGGLEAIEQIMAKHPVPILVVTALTGVRMAFTAVSKGALDVIEKPDISIVNTQNLIRKIRRLAIVDVHAHLRAMKPQPKPAVATPVATPQAGGRPGIVAIAASTGGPHAIHNILAQLPGTFPVPIVIAQHIADGFTEGMVEWLDAVTPLHVRVARHGEVLMPGNVYVNPAEHSMIVTRQSTIILGDRDQRKPYNPSCDALLSSVAASFRERSLGLIMSGMGDDGVAGMQSIRAHHGITLAQDGKSSVVFGMNAVAIQKGCIDNVVVLANLPAELLRLVVGSRQ
ncbi:chemotaxis-specific protein-glutamate methyltransferase CheB [Candidatus Symbiobacter mobilis]|uniref:Protein-glutamate methylesterase/protein-glutamine glutaminase n=1 Tax=Candidatus Symbiobacter mobilis CR TaxID=946483 RepID=U5N9X4_9BURK|nr:chemotaxis-specific protein-glutamate methyltransferase CheB [Candidatus Symbiobacter mobilis]AGX88207.1 chemotaxis response regulator CheB [Candidatus Symbiobacter mobilis CR]